MTVRTPSTFDTAALRERYPFAKLIQPRVGVLDAITALPQDLESPLFEGAAAPLGNLTMTFPHVRTEKGDVRDELIGGAGGDLDPELA
jgi:ribosomal protein S12 methylthiotransferase accessory factor